MEQSYHYLSMVNQSLFQKQVYSRIHELELTPGQPKILEYLAHFNGSIQKEIARGCQIEKATLTGILDRMEEKDLLERRCMDGNRREIHVFLTQKGEEKSKGIQQIFMNLDEKALTDITESEKAIYLEVLSKIHRNLREMEK